MGRRSRRRAGESAGAAEGSPPPADAAQPPASRAERDAIRRARRAAKPGARGAGGRPVKAGAGRPAGVRPTDARPPAPWGKLPLTELVLGLALLLAVAGVAVRGQRGATMLLASLALGAIAGLELALREHFAGYRSHSALFGLAAGTPVLTAIFLLGGRSPTAYAIAVAAGAAVFGLVFALARRAFRRRSGGLSFR